MQVAKDSALTEDEISIRMKKINTELSPTLIAKELLKTTTDAPQGLVLSELSLFPSVVALSLIAERKLKRLTIAGTERLVAR